jgi:DNA-binding NarL/FixJ family response regulator
MTGSFASPRVRVLVDHDHPPVLTGIKALVIADEEVELVGEATDGTTALSLAIERHPDAAVLDLSMPGLNGIEIARKLLAACPRCRVLVLTMHDDGAHVRKLLELGVGGYRLKRSATETLCRSIRTVAAGDVYLDPAIAGQTELVSRQEPESTALSAPTCQLSGRELEVVRLTAIGYSNKMIAAKLQIGVRSVETYKARAMEKLSIRSGVALVRFAIREGWFGPDASNE